MKTVSSPRKSRKITNDKPWFDKVCRIMKNDLRKLANEVKRNPTNHKSREKLYIAKHSFNKMLKKKKSDYKLGILNEMNVERKRDAKNSGNFSTPSIWINQKEMLHPQ